MSAPTGPVIVSAVMTAGHDGRAEAVLDVRYPNGATRSVTMTQEAVADAVRVAGVDRLDELRGHPWTVLLPGAASTGPAGDDDHHVDDHHVDDHHDDDHHDDDHHDDDHHVDDHHDEESPCST